MYLKVTGLAKDTSGTLNLTTKKSGIRSIWSSFSEPLSKPEEFCSSERQKQKPGLERVTLFLEKHMEQDQTRGKINRTVEHFPAFRSELSNFPVAAGQGHCQQD